MRANRQPITRRLIFTGPNGGHVWRTSLNADHWKPALTKAGVIPEAESREHAAAAREHGMQDLRHFYTSVLLNAGESIKALAEHLGHSDPGLTLKGLRAPHAGQPRPAPGGSKASTPTVGPHRLRFQRDPSA
jgi:integrase